MAAELSDLENSDVVHDSHGDCRAVGQILDRIGDKWTIMVVGVLANGTLRFNEIMREIGGVSHRMLTLTLRGLERDGLVTRTAYPTIPPKVEYELTELGRSLIGRCGYWLLGPFNTAPRWKWRAGILIIGRRMLAEWR